MPSRYGELKERAWAANVEIPRRGLAIYTFGNVSAYAREAGVLAIKPSGVPYEELTPEHMVVVDLEGEVVEGSLRPSSDTRTHLVLYRHFEGIGGIAHTHSTYATGWAQARCPIPVYGTTHADHLAEPVPCTEIMSDAAVDRDYETETGNQILDCFRGRDPLHTPMVLVAVDVTLASEALGKMAFVTRAVAPGAPPVPERIVQKHFERKHGAGAYYGQAGRGPAGKR